MSSAATCHIWEADRYHVHSSAQMDAAFQLLKLIQIKGHERILDVGCGDGKITAKLAEILTSGKITGIDVSSEMINFAQRTFTKDRYPNLNFSVQSAQELFSESQLDIIFSSFALQWVANPDAFFIKANNFLMQSGFLAATIPLGISDELTEAINITISSPKWSSFFNDFSPGWHFLSSEKYTKLLIDCGFKPIFLDIVSQLVVYSTRSDFEQYVKQWLSYLNPLPLVLKPIFFEQVINKYLELIPDYDGGKVDFKFLRLDLIAKKANP